MSHKSSVSAKEYLLGRICPRTGFNETVIYTGSLSHLPKGWSVIKEL